MPSDRYTETGRFATEMLLLIALIWTHRRAAQLIAAIITIRYAIALVRLLDALSGISTFEVIGQTGDWRTVFLILLVEAIVITVAHPALRNAMVCARASELKVSTRPLFTETTLIRTISAIVFTVAFPHVRYATFVKAGELRSAASHVAAFEFVRIITTIVLLITLEIQWYTTTRFTLEFIRAASWFGAVLFLVTVVQAIVVPIAHPRFRYASLIIAGEVPGVRTRLYWRFGILIDNAGRLIFSQTFAVRTGAFRLQTFGFIVGHSEADFLTSTVRQATRLCFIDGLHTVTVDFDAIQTIRLRFSNHHFFLFAG